MLVYIIDAFNVIHKIATLRNSNNPHDNFIHYVNNNTLTGSSKNKTIIIFDGQFHPTANNYGYKIMFSNERSADELIKEELARLNHKSEVIVVSDDNEVRRNAKINNARAVSVNDFTKKTKTIRVDTKEISYAAQKEITDELRKIWLNE